MAQWQPKEFAQLTGISVRTLHHYDDIDLLKPSLRLPNGYRIYSQSDLLKLQQIVALKFFGFSLQEIKKLLSSEQVYEHLEKQLKMIQQKIEHLRQVNQLLETTLTHKQNKSPDWQHIIQLIKVYNMTQNLKKSWIGDAYSDDQIRQFAELKTKFTEKEMRDYQHRWKLLWDEIEQHIDKDPKGPIGEAYAKKWVALVDEVYGEYPKLKQATYTAYKEGKIPNNGCSKKVGDWIEIAFAHHKIDRFNNIEKK